jgi:MFS family permease
LGFTAPEDDLGKIAGCGASEDRGCESPEPFDARGVFLFPAMATSTESEPRERQSGELRLITRRYYVVWWMYSLAGAFMFGVYPIFLRSRGLNQFQINSVLAIYFFVTFITDVPTGAFADAVGRRKAFLFSCATRMVAFAAYYFAHSYLYFLIAEFIDGIGTTFGNGAVEAWAVDALDQAGFEGLKDRLFSRVSQLASLGFMIAALIGAYAGDINIALPWVLGSVGYLITGLVAAVLMRGEKLPGHSLMRTEFSGLATRIARRVRGGIQRGFAKRSRVLLTLANALLFGAMAPYWLQWPQYVYDSFGAGLWLVGWLFCFFGIGRLIGSEMIGRYPPMASSRSAVLTILVAVSSALLFAAGWMGGRTDVVLTLLFGLNLCVGAIEPLARSWFNEEIDAEDRATLLSFQTTFSTLGGAIGLLLSGWIADLYGIGTAWETSGLIMAAIAPCYLALRPRPAAATIMRAADEI